MPLVETARGSIWFADHRDQSADQPTLLLVHGAGGSRLDFPASLRRLPNASLIVPDLPGHGRSPEPARRSIGDYAHDLVALMDKLSIARAVVAGQSMGGAIALAMALDYPARIAGLILLSTGAKLAVHPEILNNVLRDQSRVAAMLVDWYWSPDAGETLRSQSYQGLLQVPPEILYGDLVACNNFDVRERLSEINTPTLIVSGTIDEMTPPHYAEYLEKHISGARRVMIEGGAHMVVQEQSDAVAGVVEHWLNEVV